MGVHRGRDAGHLDGVDAELMSASITEVLMAPGSWALDLEWDPELLVAVKDSSHVLLYQGEKRVYAGVLVSRTPGRTGIRIGGFGLLWHLGRDDNTGPLILDREYVAGTNKLSNGDFELEDLYWSFGEPSFWAITEDNPLGGSWAAQILTDPAKDDALKGDEGAYPTKVGDTWQLDVWAKRLAGTVGRLRARLVFEGRFNQVGVNPGGVGNDWTDLSQFSADTEVVNDPGEAKSGDWVLRVGPCTRKQLLANGGFELGDFSYWDPGDQWALSFMSEGRSGNWAAFWDAAAGTGSTLWAASVADGSDLTFPVRPGEKYHAEGYLRSDNADAPDGDIYIQLSRFNGVEFSTTDLAHVPPNDPSEIIWRKTEVDFEIEPETESIFFALQNSSTVGKWRADDFSLTRIVGNIARLQSTDPFAVVPAKAHTLYASVRSGPDYISGSLRAQVAFSADGRPDVTQDGPSVEGTDNLWQLLTFNFTPPSGYDQAKIAWIGTDVVGDSFWINVADMLVQFDDTSTRIFDAKSTETQAAFDELSQTVDSPDGAETVRVELVAEDQGDGWVVDDVFLGRVDAPPAVTGDIVAELLTSPKTGLPILAAGQIHGIDTILYDWLIKRLTDRQALLHLSRAGVCSPVREYYVDPWFQLHWGTAEELFVQRPLVYAGEDLVFIDDPEAEISSQEHLTDVLIVGAERQKANGRRVLITGAASNPPGDLVDPFGNPVEHTRLVEDSTIDHVGYAQAYARYLADQGDHPAQATRLQMASGRAVDDFDVGDWIGVHKPEADFEDLDNPVELGGRTVFPQRLRVLSRTWRLAAGFRAELMHNDGTLEDISDAVRWEQVESADVELGDVLPEFAVDPQGGSAGRQFQRFRTNRPE